MTIDKITLEYDEEGRYGKIGNGIIKVHYRLDKDTPLTFRAVTTPEGYKSIHELSAEDIKHINGIIEQEIKEYKSSGE